VIGEIEKFILLNGHYKNVDCSIFGLKIPEKDKFPTITELRNYQTSNNELIQKYPTRKIDYSIKCSDFQELKDQLEKLYQLSISLEKSSFIFKSELINGYPGNLPILEEKLYRTNVLLAGLSENKLKELERSIVIDYPLGKNLITLKNDAQILYQYLSEGNNLTGIVFIFKKAILKKDIKERLYFIDNVKINGNFCDTTNKFESVLEDIKIKQDFEELENIWATHQIKKLNSYYDQVRFYKNLKEDTENVLSTLKEYYHIKLHVEDISTLKISQNDSQMISELLHEIDFNILVQHIILFSSRFQDLTRYFSVSQYHPIINVLLKDITKADTISYETHLAEIDKLNIEKIKYDSFKNLQLSVQKYFPDMLSEILHNTFNLLNINLLEKAISFKHAQNILTELLADEYEGVLANKLNELETRKEKIISQLASTKAWLKVIVGLKNNYLLQKHLQAWVAAVRNIRGNGQRALKFRKIAQNLMEKCKESVPCWIMPLYKVAETINPEPGYYDYVIIDEASQVGPDAIFLLYISKNIIIVGDDKQVSPEYVGVYANTMTPHIKRHLKDIPFSDFYDINFSFFDHAKMFCNGMTVLREHFRCMPEIIEFSNKYFYAPEGKGLYPLKQYSENRLEPLKKVYCQNGYTEGQHQNIINRVEAESIANTISELIKDEKYKGKTFGVITLQGNKQSFLIETLLLKKIGENEFHNRKIVCGNSASFQGDERDVVFFSLVTAHNHNRIALVKPEDERRFNVAMSRAQEQVWLFHSVQLEDLSNTNDLRYKLLDHFHNHKSQTIPLQKPIARRLGTQPEPFESWFEVDVFNDIVSKGYSVIPQYEIAKGKYRIDLVVLLENGIKFAIECDGDKFHGAEQFQNDLMRQKVLERCGWQFFRVRGFEYYSNRNKALDPFWKIINAFKEQKDDLTAFYNDQHSNIVNKPILETSNNKNTLLFPMHEQNQILFSEQINSAAPNIIELKESKDNIGKISTNPIKLRTRPTSQRMILLEKDKFICNSSVEVLINTCNWLIEKGKISASKCPIKLQIGGNSYLINTRPYHANNKMFISKKDLKNNLFLEGNWSTANCIKRSKELLLLFGIPLTNFNLDLSISPNSDNQFLLPETDILKDEMQKSRINREHIPIENSSKINNEELIADIILALLALDGSGEKKQVEKILFKKHEEIFRLPYYQQLVSNGVPRWQHNIAWAKEEAKNRGLLNRPSDSGRGIWELTERGKSYK
jgi:very-short-patch-repair endonuclease